MQRAMTKVRAEVSAETRRRQMPLGHGNLGRRSLLVADERTLPFEVLVAPSMAART
jgi:hypothetical protein